MAKVTIKATVFLCLFFITLSCSSNKSKQQTIEKNEIPVWIIGLWQQEDEDEDEPYNELWRKSGDTLLGGGYFTNQIEIDTLNLQVKIYPVKNGLVHEFIGSAELTLFPVKIVDDKSFICVNPDQKTFPSAIKYTLLNSHQMIVEITGYVDGIKDTYAFNMFKK